MTRTFGEARSVGNYTAASTDPPYFDRFSCPTCPSASTLFPPMVLFPIPLRKHPVKRGIGKYRIEEWIDG